MAEHTTQIVQNVSDGTVTIALEKYQEMLAAAAEKAPIYVTTVQKTAAMVSNDNKAWGAVFIGGGLALTALGAGLSILGYAQAKALVAEVAEQNGLS